MIRVPTARRRRKPEEKLNLTSIMDAIFIFIFFLLTSVNFVKIMEIGSDVPIISENDPPDDKEPLALQIVVKEDAIDLTQGIEQQLIGSFSRGVDGKYKLTELHDKLVSIKREKSHEESIIITPEWDIAYEDLVQIMDAVRLLEKTDEAIFKKGKDGIDVKVESLFPKILFSNLMS